MNWIFARGKNGGKSMSRSVDFYYDIGSPNCYMAHKALGPILERTEAKVNYKICLLGGVFKATGNQPPWMTAGKVKPKMDFMMLEIKRFLKEHGLSKFAMTPHFPLNSLLSMRAAITAEAQGRLGEYFTALETLIWEEGVKMDDPEIFAASLTEKGFDGAGLLASTQDAAVKERLKSYTEAAVSRGIFGVPTFFVGDEMFFGKDQLHRVEAELLKH